MTRKTIKVDLLARVEGEGALPVVTLKPEEMEFRGITSHDFKLGLRWMLDAPMERKQMIDLPPLMRKG